MLTAQDLDTTYTDTSTLLDYALFYRTVTRHLLLPGDLTVTDDVIIFRKQRTKKHRDEQAVSVDPDLQRTRRPSFPPLDTSSHASVENNIKSRGPLLAPSV